MDDVRQKEAAGFNTTITDLWGRGLSFQLFNASTGGPGKSVNRSVQFNANKA
jgi:lysophospholipase